MVERLTREQMNQKYPNQWIGISNIKYDNDDATLLEADVVLIGKTKEELKELQFSGAGVVGWGRLMILQNLLEQLDCRRRMYARLF